MLRSAFVVISHFHAALGLVYGPTDGQTWVRTSYFTFDLQIRGLGLSSADSIRIIEPGHSCTEDSGDVKSADPTIQWNCPNIGSGCQSVRAFPPIDIPTRAISWDCLSLDIQNVCSGGPVLISGINIDTAGLVTLTFSNSTTLRAGDYIQLGSGVVCGSGCDESKLNLLKGGSLDATSDAFKIGHALSIQSGDPAFTFRMSVPELASGSPPIFLIDPSGAGIQWSVTNLISTRVELKGLLEKREMQVCWNSGGRPGGYTTAAGSLDMTDAPAMLGVGVHPVSNAPVNGSLPMILSFTTSSSSAYVTADGYSEIIVTFPTNGTLGLRWLDNTDITVATTTPTQHTCSKLFLETWSSDASLGFPYPVGCYVTILDANADYPGFDIHVVFDRGNGLNRRTNYQLTINGVIEPDRLAACTDDCSFFTITTVADIDSAPYVAIERGVAGLPDSYPLLFNRTGANPVLTTATLAGSEDSVLTLHHGDSITVTLQGGDGTTTGSIKAAYFVRVILFPFTQWRLRDVCSAAVVPTTPDDVSYTGPAPLCRSEAIVAGGQNNVIVVQLPDDIPEVKLNDRISIRISGLAFPSTGFFNVPVGIQVSDANDAFPYFTWSSTAVAKSPDAGRTVARIVREEAVTDFSFKNETNRSIVVELVPALAGLSSNTVLQFLLPPGWECLGVSDVAADEAFFTAIPSGRGTLDALAFNAQDRVCNFTFEPLPVIGSSLYFTLNVNYPATAAGAAESVIEVMFTDDVNGTSANPQTQSTLFYASATNDPGFVTAISIMGIITEAHIEPASGWLPSEPGIVRSGLVGIFFAPEQTIENQGFVRISLPPGYSVPLPCVAVHLSDYVYSTADVDTPTVSKLPGLDPTCVAGDDAKVTVAFSGTLVGGSRYALGLTVANPVLDARDQPDGVWLLRTMDANASLVDGTVDSIPLFESGPDSFGLYAAQTDLTVDIPDLTPYSLSQSAVPMGLNLTMALPGAPLRHVNVRVSIPVGFEIDSAAAQTVPSGNVTTVWPPIIATDLPHVVLFQSVPFVDGYATVSLTVRVPDRPPSLALYSFRVEFGFDATQLQDKLLVATTSTSDSTTAGGAVKGISNGIVSSCSPVVSLENLIRLAFTVHAPVPSGGTVVISVPEAFTIEANCTAVPDGPPLSITPSSVCRFANSTVEIYNEAGGVDPGDYALFVRAVNPPTPTPLTPSIDTACGSSLCFTFATLSNRSDNTSLIELPLSIPGFAITDSIPVAGIVSLAHRTLVGRDDRPNYPNSFLVYFQPIRSSSSLTVRAPEGFVFNPDCLPDSSVNRTVFGPGIPWPPGFARWPVGTAIQTCRGDGNVATLTFSASLEVNNDLPYVMRIGVRANPPFESAVCNQWTLLFGTDQASIPFDSFPLWTFDDASNITAMVTGLRGASVTEADNLNYVSIRIKPFNAVVLDGSIIITPPSGFSVPPDFACESLAVAASDGRLWDRSSLVCQILDGDEAIRFLVPANESLLSSEWYVVTLAVLNPDSMPEAGSVDYWTVQSFTGTSPLDESRLPSFPLVDRPASFTLNDYHSDGEELIKALVIRASFDSVDITAGISLTVAAPPTFVFTGIDAGAAMLVANRHGLIVLDPSTTIVCDGNTITVTFAQFIQAAYFISLSIPVVNPAQTPTPVNYFVASLWDANASLVASGGVQGWTIVPRLQDVEVALVGPRMATESISSLTVGFRSVSPFNEIEIEFPPSFDLTKSVSVLVKSTVIALTPLSTTLSSAEAYVVIYRFTETVAGNTLMNVSLTGVQLGSLPGPIAVHITTRKDTVIADRRLRFIAFDLPGLLTVDDQALSTEASRAVLTTVGSTSALSRYFIARTGEVGLVSFNCSFDETLMPGDQIVITSSAYSFTDLDSQSVRLSYDVDISTFYLKAIRTVTVGIANVNMSADSITATLVGTVQSTSVLTVHFPALIPALVSDAQTSFQIQTWSSANPELPSNTNDNMTVGFAVVHPINFTVSAVTSPPSASVTVYIDLLEVGLLKSFSVVLVAPEGYTFVQPDCLAATGNSSAIACISSTLFDNTRHSALITFATLRPSRGLAVSVVTPLATPDSNDWLMIANGLSAVQTGWGVASDPIQVVPMAGVSVAYTRLLNVETQVAFTLTTFVPVRKGGRLRIYYPAGFVFDCTTFNKVSLPFFSSDWTDVCVLNSYPLTDGETTTIDIAQSSIDLMFLQDFVPGTYSFTIGATTPSEVVVDPSFSLVLMDSANQVVDAYIDLIGESFLPTSDPASIQVQLVPGTDSLQWFPTTVVGGTTMEVLLKFDVKQQINIAIDGFIPIGSISIWFPPNVISAIQTPGDVVENNTVTPIMTGLNFTNADHLVVAIDTTSKISQGTYGFRFPVLVPPQMPPINVWFISFCALNSTSCTSPTDTGMVASLPVGGFLIGQVHPHLVAMVFKDAVAPSIGALSVLALVLLAVIW